MVNITTSASAGGICSSCRLDGRFVKSIDDKDDEDDGAECDDDDGNDDFSDDDGDDDDDDGECDGRAEKLFWQEGEEKMVSATSANCTLMPM